MCRVMLVAQRKHKKFLQLGENCTICCFFFALYASVSVLNLMMEATGSQ